MNNLPERSATSNDMEKAATTLINARKWLQTSQTYLDRRVAEYRDTGNHAAAASLSTIHQQTLDFLSGHVADGDGAFIEYLGGLETTASDNRPYDSPNYIGLHGPAAR